MVLVVLISVLVVLISFSKRFISVLAGFISFLMALISVLAGFISFLMALYLGLEAAYPVFDDIHPVLPD
ncbi:hypothetical protein [Indiicoccus explosivorum]|uniref:hypothetical protein n=1 Tax=Indiicoccus explosivorum TaxID=1917864 RepID=UPI000B4476FA|nr:hypothetical protein [Indiicoccus explosivorum]